MPIYTICTEEDLAEFYPLLKHLFVAVEMFNILKLNHSEENCNAGAGPVLNGAYPLLHLIYLHPDLESFMRQILNHLKQVYPIGDPNDPRNFLNCLLMCPTCGRRYEDQPNRSSRSS